MGVCSQDSEELGMKPWPRKGNLGGEAAPVLSPLPPNTPTHLHAPVAAGAILTMHFPSVQSPGQPPHSSPIKPFQDPTRPASHPRPSVYPCLSTLACLPFCPGGALCVRVHARAVPVSLPVLPLCPGVPPTLPLGNSQASVSRSDEQCRPWGPTARVQTGLQLTSCVTWLHSLTWLTLNFLIHTTEITV